MCWTWQFRPTTQSSSRVSGPISLPAPTTVLPAQDRPRVQRDVAAELDGDVDERLAGIEHRHAVEQPAAVGATAQLALGEGQLPAVVDALGLRAGRLDASDPVTHAGEHTDDVGEVQLALRVVGGDAAQGRSEQVPPEGVDARGDLGDGPLVGRCVALLDDAQDLAVATGDDPAVAGRVLDDARQQRRRAAVGDVGGDQLVERLRQQQGRVTGDDDDRRVVVEVVAGERRHADGRGVARAALGGLLDEHDVRPGRREVLDLLGDLLGAMTDDEGRARRLQPFEGGDDVHHHGPAAHHVQRLGPGRAHPACPRRRRGRWRRRS